MIKYVVLLILISIGGNANGQSFEVGLMSFPSLIGINQQYESMSFNPSLNGGGLKFSYTHPIKTSNFQYIFGAELSYVDWGTQLISRIGASTFIKKNNKFGIELNLLNGIALYVKKSAYVFGGEGNVFFYLPVKQKNRIKLSAGLRFTQNNQYKTIGYFRYLDVPLSFSWKFGK